MKTSLLAAAVVATVATASPAFAAANFSFLGQFTQDNDVQLFNFTVGAASRVTLVSYSYAGGLNAAGQTIVAGGFDPILSLYDSNGRRIDDNDDGYNVPYDPVTNASFDTLFSATLAPGIYTVALTQFDNRGPLYLTAPFSHADEPNFTGRGCAGGTGLFWDATCHQRDGHWAFDVLNVADATAPGGLPGGVPEPATWAMMLTGFGLAGAALRRRRAQGLAA